MADIILKEWKNLPAIKVAVAKRWLSTSVSTNGGERGCRKRRYSSQGNHSTTPNIQQGEEQRYAREIPQCCRRKLVNESKTSTPCSHCSLELLEGARGSYNRTHISNICFSLQVSRHPAERGEMAKRKRHGKFTTPHSTRTSQSSAKMSSRRRQRYSRVLIFPFPGAILWALLLIQMLRLPNTPFLPGSHAAVSCDPTAPNDDECASLLRPGSTCSPDGFCTNPFRQGCLRNYLGPEQISDMRTCNSDDDVAFDENGTPICTPSPLGYSEIRILAQNWETTMFTSWILQIVLSELLQVPATLELSEPDRELNFYSPTNAFDYGAMAYDFDALRRANEYLVTAVQVGTVTTTKISSTGSPEKGTDIFGRQTAGDCPKEWRVPPTDEDGSRNWKYQSCAHVMVEAWSGQAPTVNELAVTKVVEPPEGTGVVGKLGWFVPKYLVEQDPSLAHWIGLTGEANRRKIAELFRVPITYGRFCREVVPHNCTVPTIFASRPPKDESEASKYFVAGGAFDGYFHFTPDNDCDANPTTCVGHITDVPCAWTTFAIPQAYHLNISVASRGPLKPNFGYSYGDLLDIWAAANATNSPVLMYWWYPDPTYQFYMGLPAEMQAVQLPPPRQECVTNRVTPDQKCSDTPLEERVGDPRGACDSEPHSLMKLTVANLFPYLNGVSGESTSNSTIDGTTNVENKDNKGDQQSQPSTQNAALKSPAYEAIQALSINELHLGDIMEAWESRGIDKWNYDPRDAVCEWVVDNLPTLRTWIPRTYPRIIQTEAHDNGREILFGFAIGMGSCVSALVLATTAVTYWWRRRPLLVFAQVGFLYILLLGLFFVTVGAVLKALEPKDWSCMAQHWFITLGYTLELIPLIVKVSAIHRMMQAARKMRRVTLQHRQLYGTVVVVSLAAAVILSIWTAIDPSRRRVQITLHPERITEKGDTVVTVTYFCSSEHHGTLWRYLSLGWQLVLLLCATVLAVQTRKTRRDLNESSSLGTLIYSHFFFVILRSITYVLERSSEPGNEIVGKGTLEGLRSLILSGDVFVALNIYFTPKMYSLFKYDDAHFKTIMSNQRRSSVRSLHQRGSSFTGSVGVVAGSFFDETESGNVSKKRRSSKFSASQIMDIAKFSSSGENSSGSMKYGGEKKDDDQLATIYSVSASNSGIKPSESSTNANENRIDVSEKITPAARMSSIDSSCISISSDEKESYQEMGPSAVLEPGTDSDEKSKNDLLGMLSETKGFCQREQDAPLMGHTNDQGRRSIQLKESVNAETTPIPNISEEATGIRTQGNPTENGMIKHSGPTVEPNGTVGDTTQTDSASSAGSPKNHCLDDLSA